jgi:hypothetical protein
MGDWLGTGTIAAHLREYRSFTQARAFIHSLNLKNQAEWNKFCRGKMKHLGLLPTDIPVNPWRTYSDKGWSGLGDWLGTGTIAARLRKYRTFTMARAYARSLKLKSAAEWRAFCKGEMPEKGDLPADISKAPNQKYADKGWKSWGDWLGTGRIADQLKRYRSFSKARAFARNLRLKSRAEWHAFCKGEMLSLGQLPKDIPSSPNNTYATQGWVGMGDWLGTGRTRVSKSAKRKS